MNDPSWSDLVQRLERVLCSPIDISDTQSVLCSASIGHADTRTVDHETGALLAAADAAMYERKRVRCHTPIGLVRDGRVQRAGMSDAVLPSR